MDKLLLISLSAEDAAAGAGFAQSYGLPFDILLLTGEGAANWGAQTVLCAGAASSPMAEWERQIPSEGYSCFAAVSAMWSRDLLSRLAGRLGAAMVSDAVGREGDRFIRPVLAGSSFAVVEVLSSPLVITFRPAGFAPAAEGGQSAVQTLNWDASSLAKRVSESKRGGARPSLAAAKTVVSGGRPLKDAEMFERLIGGLADLLGGAAGATRAAVDSGIAPNEIQVGQTGKVVAPDLYIAAGISGSTQHMAGIKDSKIIVAINKDQDAPIFDAADYGLVADLYEAIPEIMDQLSKK